MGVPCTRSYGPARLVGGDHFLSLLQEHQSSPLEDPAWALTVLGTCPLGRFYEKEGPEQTLHHLCCRPHGIQSSSPAAGGMSLPKAPVGGEMQL